MDEKRTGGAAGADSVSGGADAGECVTRSVSGGVSAGCGNRRWETVDYDLLAEQMDSLADGVESEISNLANASALLYQTLEGLNWAGFYLYQGGELRLGPFQGKIACTRIAMGKGVCGTAAAEDQTVVVRDVHQFPGHIACDGASNSEIVIPLHKNGELYGVLDIDSPFFGRFGEKEKAGLERFAKTLEKVIASGGFY